MLFSRFTRHFFSLGVYNVPKACPSGSCQCTRWSSTVIQYYGLPDYERSATAPSGWPICLDLHWATSNSLEWRLYMLLISLTLFIIPAIIIMSCYSVILCTVWSSSDACSSWPRSLKVSDTAIWVKSCFGNTSSCASMCTVPGELVYLQGMDQQVIRKGKNELLQCNKIDGYEACDEIGVKSCSPLLKAFHIICGYYGLLVIERIVDVPSHANDFLKCLHTGTHSNTFSQCGYRHVNLRHGKTDDN